jgi:cytoskeletal protein CcmA (bactofilin family)
MNHLKLITIGIGVAVLSLAALTGIAGAQNFKSGDNVTVMSNEIVDSMLFAGGKNINIAGTVNGDVYCAGQTIAITGTINGDVFCAGQTITVSGTVNGSVRLAGQIVTLSGVIDDSATIGAQDLTIHNTSIIG